MKSYEFLPALVLALTLGLGTTIVLHGLEVFSGKPAANYGPASASVPTEPITPTLTPALSGTSMRTQSTPTPTLPPLEVGSREGEDLEDVLLLYDSAHVSGFDINFCKIAGYYGLLCRRIALDGTELTDRMLRDPKGGYFKLIGIDAATLLRSPSPLAGDELEVVKAAIETHGSNLLVFGMDDELDPTLLTDLTDDTILGAARTQDSRREWFVSSAAPEITREFTGQVISSTSASEQNDFALILREGKPVTALITSTDDTGASYPIFVRVKKSAGSIFVDAGERGEGLERLSLREMYYAPFYFSDVVAQMLTIRHALADEAWHNNHDYANLTVDDPAMTEPWNELSFTALLKEMKAHNFHTTIAMHPRTWTQSEPTVISLFRNNPDRYSLAQHGNNGDGYEFYKYKVSRDDEFEGQKLPARPLYEQEADIMEGLARMAQHQMLTGVPCDRVMIFPWGISPEPTLVLLKKYNFLATVNAQDVPLEATCPPDWDYGMYQANMDYGNFPLLTRRHPGTYQPLWPRIQPFIFDLFVDKPALFYSHVGELFKAGIDTFDPVADQINSLTGGVEWRSLGYIIRRLYLEKTNDDGSIDVKMYGNHLIITNESSREHVYHIRKEETLNVPISRLTVNGHGFPYQVEDGLLKLDVRVPAGSSAEIRIHYGG